MVYNNEEKTSFVVQKYIRIKKYKFFCKKVLTKGKKCVNILCVVGFADSRNLKI